MSAETASSSDVASVENGTAVQQNFTPPVSKSALFDNIGIHRSWISKSKNKCRLGEKLGHAGLCAVVEARHESPLPPGTPLSRTDFLRKGFLRDCRGRAYQPLQRDEPAQTRF